MKEKEMDTSYTTIPNYSVPATYGPVSPPTSLGTSTEKSGMVGIIIAIIALLLIIMLIVAVGMSAQHTAQTGLARQIIIGKTSDNASTQTFDGNEYYRVAPSVTGFRLTRPNLAIQGKSFTIDNQINTVNFTLTGDSTVSFQSSGLVPRGRAADFIWLDNSGSITRVDYFSGVTGATGSTGTTGTTGTTVPPSSCGCH